MKSANRKSVRKKSRAIPRVIIDLDSVNITESDWQKLTAILPLTPQTKIQIQAAIAVYQADVRTNKIPLRLKRAISQARTRLAKLRNGLKRLSESEEFFAIGRTWATPRDEEEVQIFERSGSHLAAIDEMLAAAQLRMKLRRGRKSNKPLYFLVQRFAWAYSDLTGKAPTRSDKQGEVEERIQYTSMFIKACVRIADPKVRTATVNNVIKQWITEYHNVKEQFGFDIAQGRKLSRKKPPIRKKR